MQIQEAKLRAMIAAGELQDLGIEAKWFSLDENSKFLKKMAKDYDAKLPIEDWIIVQFDLKEQAEADLMFMAVDRLLKEGIYFFGDFMKNATDQYEWYIDATLDLVEPDPAYSLN